MSYVAKSVMVVAKNESAHSINEVLLAFRAYCIRKEARNLISHHYQNYSYNDSSTPYGMMLPSYLTSEKHNYSPSLISRN